MCIDFPFPRLGVEIKLVSFILSFLLVLFQPQAVTVSATVMIYSDSLPETLTSECSKALLIDVTACDPLVKNLRADFFYPPKSLSRICVDDCSSALATWVSSVRTSCGNQTVPGDLEMEAAAVYFPGSLEYAFQFSCLQDASGRYCGPVAALAAAFSDPGINPFNYISNTTGQDKPDNCDLCLAERLRLRAGSPYFDGPIVASESLYESMTSSCTITGRPISKTTVDYFTSTPTPTASTCDGSKYTVQASDDCYSISRDQGIGTAWLLADNHLDAYCANFPGEGTELCMANKCATVTVGVNATCADIAGTANITESQLHAWNPIINYACTNLASMNGTEVCVDAPGRKFVTPTDTSALPPMTPTVPATIPTNAADGSDKPCGRWYSVQEGDYCNLLTLKFGISLNDLIFLNPALNVNCTNLLADESYCVQAVGDINTYSGRPGQMTLTIDPNATFTGVPFTQLPDATDTGYKRLYTPLPTATGTRDDCVEYFPGDDYQLNVTGTNFANPCLIAVAVYNVDLDSFASWNAGLNLSSPSCAFETGVRYCGSWYLQPPDKLDPTPTSSSGPPGPTMSGQPADCNKWAVVEDGVTCSDLAAAAGISLDQFLAWNPTVSSDCSTNYWIGNAYCVGVSSSSSTSPTTSPPTATSQGPPGPTMSGEPDNCNKWTVVTDGLTCTELADDAGISLDQFLAWNPAVSSDCLTNYWLGEAYCVGVSSSSSTSPPTKPPTSTSSGPPGPTMSGEPDNCNKWTVVTEGLTCTELADDAGISLDQFLAWNPAVSSDCLTNYWLGEAYCIGVADTMSSSE